MFIVEGNIGAGKSTFLTLVRQNASLIEVALEPLVNWQKEIYGHSLLENFYEYPQRWAYTLETFTLICRVKEHLKDQTNSNPYLLVERSIFSGHYVFAKNSYEQGFLSSLEWDIYLHLFNLLTRPCKMPLGFIYLRTKPEIAFERLKKRNRSAELTITLEYIHQIHEKHEAFLGQAPLGLTIETPEGQRRSFPPIPVLILNCDEEFQDNPPLFGQHLSTIKEFMALQVAKAAKL